MSRGRPKNSAETVTITISTTPMMRSLLETLVEEGVHGKNVAEAADRLLSAKIQELLRANDRLADRLNKTQIKVLGHPGK